MIYTVRLLHFCADLRGGRFRMNNLLTYYRVCKGVVVVELGWGWSGMGVVGGPLLGPLGPYWALLGRMGAQYRRARYFWGDFRARYFWGDPHPPPPSQGPPSVTRPAIEQCK